jgi:putative peptidoglycan lipid II flippase
MGYSLGAEEFYHIQGAGATLSLKYTHSPTRAILAPFQSAFPEALRDKTSMTHIARSTLIIALFFGLEKVLGFVRQLLIARQFGLSAELDAFNAANNLPDLIFGLISGGALAVAFIPVLSQYLQEKGREPMWDLFSRVANLIFLVTAALSILAAILAPQLVQWGLGIAPGFDTAQQAVVSDLMRLNLVATLLFSVSGLVIAGLQANQHFFLPALARGMYDIGTLIGVLFLAPATSYQIGPISLPTLGLGVYGLTYGTIVGALLFLAVQLPGLVRYRFRWAPRIDLHNPGLRHVLRLMGPRVATMFFIYMALIYIPDNLASSLPEGSVTALVYGWLIMQVPETLIGTAIGTVLLPTVSEQVVRGEGERFARSINYGLRAILALTLPAAVLLWLGVRPLVGVFGFDAAGTDMVVWTARAYLLGLVGHSLLEVAARGHYARQDALTPLWASVLMAVIFTLLAVLLSQPFGAPGIALANTIAFTGEGLLLLYLLNRRLAGILRLGNTLLRVGLASLGVGVLVYALIALVPLPALVVAVGSLTLGALLVLPFIWPEVKLLINL